MHDGLWYGITVQLMQTISTYYGAINTMHPCPISMYKAALLEHNIPSQVSLSGGTLIKQKLP
jgi:hypothetical protein